MVISKFQTKSFKVQVNKISAELYFYDDWMYLTLPPQPDASSDIF